MKQLFFFLLLVFSANAAAQNHTGNWNSVRISADTLMGIDDIFFVDSSAGYMWGYYQPPPDPFEHAPIFKWYRTLDGGLSWTRIFEDVPRSILNNIDQESTPTHNSIFITSSSLFILFSLDNGTHWDSIKSDLNFDHFFSMFNEKKGFTIGGTKKIPKIVQTHDGGYSFPDQIGDSLFSATLNASEASGNPLHYAGEFSSQLYGTFIVNDPSINQGKGLTTIITKHQGAAWEKHHTDFPMYSNDTLMGDIQYQKGTPNLWFLPWASKNDLYSRSKQFIMTYCFSTDYGSTWDYDTSFAKVGTTFYGVTPGNIWMTLRGNGKEINAPPYSYSIAHTTDFGTSWDIDSVTLKYGSDLGKSYPQAIYFTDANHGWIAAVNNNQPYVFIYHPIKNSVIEHGLAAKRQLPVFPVPATNQVTINLPEGFSALSAQIYDIVGRQYSAPYKIQNNTVVIDTHDLPPGIWLAIVKHTYGTNTTRFILQK